MRRNNPADGKDKVMTDTMIQRHKCECDKCGTSHWVERVVEMKTLPIGVEVLVVPLMGSSKWEITIINHIKDAEETFEVDNWKQIKFLIENVARVLCREGYRFIVETPRSRYETHSRINRLELFNWVDDTFATKKKKDDWYADLVSRMGRQAVKASNKIERVGYKR